MAGGADRRARRWSNEWGLPHLRVGLAALLIVAVVGCPICAAVRGAQPALSFLGGLALVAAFFWVGSMAVAAAGRIADSLTLPVALGTYIIKIGLMALIILSVGVANANTTAFAVAVLAGGLSWAAAHAVAVWKTPMYYVDPGVDPGADPGAARDRRPEPARDRRPGVDREVAQGRRRRVDPDAVGNRRK